MSTSSNYTDYFKLLSLNECNHIALVITFYIRDYSLFLIFLRFLRCPKADVVHVLKHLSINFSVIAGCGSKF